MPEEVGVPGRSVPESSDLGDAPLTFCRGGAVFVTAVRKVIPGVPDTTVIKLWDELFPGVDIVSGIRSPRRMVKDSPQA